MNPRHGRKYRLIPVLLCALGGAATVLVTQLSPGQHWLQIYGPNTAVMLFGVTLTLGFVQYFLDREEAQRLEPARRAATAYVVDLYWPLRDMVVQVHWTLVDDKAALTWLPDELVDDKDTSTWLPDDEHGRAFGRLLNDELPPPLDMDAGVENVMGSGGVINWRGSLYGYMRQVLSETQGRYEAHQAEITVYCSVRVASAVQALMQGRSRGFIDHVVECENEGDIATWEGAAEFGDAFAELHDALVAEGAWVRAESKEEFEQRLGEAEPKP